MKTIDKLKYVLFYSLSFLGFIGYYFILTILLNGSEYSTSKFTSLSLALSLNICLISLFFICKKRIKIDLNAQLFIFYSIIYLIRILLDTLNNRHYYISTGQVFVMFLLFMVTPFIVTKSIRISLEYFDIVRKAIIFGSLLFVVIALVYYKNQIGSVGRIGNLGNNDSVSSLSFSYSGALAIGVGITFMINNKILLKNRIYIISVIGLSTILFFLGSSRGALVALLVTFLFIPLSKKGLTNRLGLLLIGGLLILGIIFISNYYHSNLMARVLGTNSAIEHNGSSAARLPMWKDAFSQFVDNPIIGDQLGVKRFGYFYPHNIFFESLLTTGILGFVPLFWLMINGIKKAIKIVRSAPQYSWLSIVFIQSFIQAMFSSVTYQAFWLWLSFGLLLAFPIPQKRIEVRELKSK